MPRQARLDAPGTLHHVIVRGIEKGRIVDDRGDRGNFVSRMGQVASDMETVIYAWALMTSLGATRSEKKQRSSLSSHVKERTSMQRNCGWEQSGGALVE